MGQEADIVLINPGDRKQVYQGLGNDFSAIEPPFWVAVIAAYLRDKRFKVAIIDANADNLSPLETAEKIKHINPLLTCVVVYGSQPSASTQNMTIASRICDAVKENTESKVALGGLHPSALPERTLKEGKADFVIEGEGHSTIERLLSALRQGNSGYSNIPGLWYYEDEEIRHNSPYRLSGDLDEELPIAAWDLLPMEKYRAHNWHCFDDIHRRMPYAAIYTSLGCPYSCNFCCINSLFGKPGIRYRSPELVLDEISLLVNNYGIRNIKIVDELFVLNERHYLKIVDMLLERKYDLNIWAYARVDTIHTQNLKKMKGAGINWLALGIESANPSVRDGAAKRMKVMDIKKVVEEIRKAGIRVIGNFIFGLPDDTLKTMQETLSLAVEINCEFVNFYSAMAYPGSKLYDYALKAGWRLPEAWHGFSQHSYETLPLPTKHIGAEEVLRFRDNAFHLYFENPRYLNMIKDTFGDTIKEHILDMTRTRLKRKILEEGRV